ncbi:P-loop containing nucleoside triphosphate hydrolases superfamily protein [Striga hermonthica]|uniref:P-loop containing nucleoside triphosphate hydrolases superfamily protein n=1 Tax=Striga hermonthica TaxID=68872 RepID=A0A9N7NSS1_STRHE|nr:P-loop containing nucleoside triphosphate hydrolases superfamily protein [Striga hermonthica]
MLRGAKNMKAKQGIMWSRATRSASYTSIAPKKPWSQKPSHQLLSADITSPRFLLQSRFSSSESSLNDCKIELQKLNNALKHVQDVLAKGVETKKPYESPLLARAASYREEFLSRIVSFEGINETTKETWDKFPYYINEHDKNLLVEHLTARLKENKCSKDFGQRGEVREVKGDRVAVIFYENGESDGKSSEPPVHWLAAKHIQRDTDAQTHDCYLAMDVLFEVLESHPSIMVYFPDSFSWLPERSYWSYYRARKEFFGKVKEMFDQLSERKVLIYGQNKSVPGSKELELILNDVNEDVNEDWRRREEEEEVRKLFPNIISIVPPKDKNLVKKLGSQILKDEKKMISRRNISAMQKVLKEHDLACKDLELVHSNGLKLNRQDVDKIVAWATNHHLSSCHAPSVKNGQLHMPRSSFEHAILRLKESENKFSKSPMELASGQYEKSFLSCVISPDDIGVKFDDVGALDVVKKALNETVILPLKRPELFSRGNLLRPCKGMLLFGPPGTGKTLIAKALATEAGAHFINVTPSSLGSKWYGESENLTKALFTLAVKLAPTIIFVDEIDALLGARGKYYEGEASRKVKNEFMSAWDGLASNDSQRILVLGASNRPFDLDDAVIRRMPRRIHVDLPDVKNRVRILDVLLGKEALESGFDIKKLAESTEGYSGSDLKNLCVAAAYIPVQELLEQESKGLVCDPVDVVPKLRPLKLDDFIHSKAKVRPSVSYDSTSLKELQDWNDQYGEGEGTNRACLKNLATNSYERSFISGLVSPDEIRVEFKDVGALEDPCKGMLLFGPPGTGKTLIAKALATEAGAHFINVTPSSLTSKVGEANKLMLCLVHVVSVMSMRQPENFGMSLCQLGMD